METIIVGVWSSELHLLNASLCCARLFLLAYTVVQLRSQHRRFCTWHPPPFHHSITTASFPSLAYPPKPVHSLPFLPHTRPNPLSHHSRLRTRAAPPRSPIRSPAARKEASGCRHACPLCACCCSRCLALLDGMDWWWGMRCDVLWFAVARGRWNVKGSGMSCHAMWCGVVWFLLRPHGSQPRACAARCGAAWAERWGGEYLVC